MSDTITVWEDGNELDVPRAFAERTGDIYECGDCRFWHCTDDFITHSGTPLLAVVDLQRRVAAWKRDNES